jgi:hypothetical protein
MDVHFSARQHPRGSVSCAKGPLVTLPVNPLGLQGDMSCALAHPWDQLVHNVPTARPLLGKRGSLFGESRPRASFGPHRPFAPRVLPRTVHTLFTASAKKTCRYAPFGQKRNGALHPEAHRRCSIAPAADGGCMLRRQ